MAIFYADDAKGYKQIFNRRDKENFQRDQYKLNTWANKWLIKLNISECKKKVSFGRHTKSTEYYSNKNVELENFDSIKGLSLTLILT